jgi:serine/threonine-protein kinase RCK2
MSTIQNLKNFIRHGKQARASNAPHGDPTINISPIHAQQQRHHGTHAPVQGTTFSDPSLAGHKSPQQPLPVAGDYSAANLDNRKNAAQAAGVAANTQGQHQKVANGDRRKHEAEIEQIVAEEREQRGKMPRYPGLERYHLTEKMGDGAFSNVYRAKDTTGQYDEVAIKVVRKFEMNSNQVCSVADASISLDPFPPFPFLSFLPPKPFIPLHLETSANKGAS